jgi:rod shape-determining protein MreC
LPAPPPAKWRARWARPGAQTRNASQGLFAAVGAYFNAGRQNAALTREVQAARADAVTMRALAQENARLKALLGHHRSGIRPVAGARLIGSTATSTRRFAVLSVGTHQGAQTASQPVRAAGGLIGRVSRPGPSARAAVTDPDNVVPVRRASDGLTAFVQGGANGQIDIRLINTGVATLPQGRCLRHSGSGGLYPPGIPVAATQPHRDGATGHLASDPSDADFVVVLPAWQASAQAPSKPRRRPPHPCLRATTTLLRPGTTMPLPKPFLARAARRPRAARLNRGPSPVLAQGLPWISIMLASMVTFSPIVASAPVLPPLGYHDPAGLAPAAPTLLPVWAGLPLGLSTISTAASRSAAGSCCGR